MRLETSKRLQQARASLVLGSPFFGLLALRLDMVGSAEIETASTDGKTILWNEDFVAGRTDADLRYILAHEVMHCALKHHVRRGHRDPKRWNEACDHAVNLELGAAGLPVPSDALADPAYTGLSAEAIYDQLPHHDGGQAPQSGHGAAGWGEVCDAPASDGAPVASEADKAEQGREWDVAIAQAAQAAKAAGRLPGEQERFARAAVRETEDWATLLRRFFSASVETRPTWSRPNRRFISSGLYIPAHVADGLGTVAVAVDTSGSVSQAVLDAFAADLSAISTEARPARIVVIYCDTQVRHVEEIEPGEPVELRAHGGGGTDFRPPFDYLDAEGIVPAALVYLTDLECSRYPDPPPYPVLWAVRGRRADAPFGEIVRVS